jgi:SagB-type dehydrogenase family enzyme
MLEISKHHLVSQMIESSSKPQPAPPPLLLATPEPSRPTRAPILLAPPVALPVSLVDAIESRRSGLYPGPISAVDLSTLLDASTAELPHSLQRAGIPRPRVVALVRQVTGIAPGCYYYEPLENLLIPHNVVDGASDRPMMLQDEHQHAAVILIFIAPLAGWLHEAGDRGYRAIALSIGYLTDRLYLVAEALRLSYTASGGFSPPMVDRMLGLDGYHEAAFFSFVVSGARP